VKNISLGLIFSKKAAALYCACLYFFASSIRSATVERITISLDPELAGILDEMSTQHGYASRSEAVRDLIRGWHSQEAMKRNKSEHCVAYLGYVYDQRDRTLAERIAHIQHEHHHLTVSNMQLHMDHNNCLEVAFLRGPSREVRSLAERVMSQRGVRHGSVSFVPVTVQGDIEGHDHAHGMPHMHLKPSI
jgi:CopG family nickel-responsive transcriptional regulator